MNTTQLEKKIMPLNQQSLKQLAQGLQCLFVLCAYIIVITSGIFIGFLSVRMSVSLIPEFSVGLFFLDYLVQIQRDSFLLISLCFILLYIF